MCCSELQRVVLSLSNNRCSVFYCIAVHCSALQRISVYYSVLRCVAACCSTLQHIAVCCSASIPRPSHHWYSALRGVVRRCSVLQCVAVRWSVLQCIAVCCSELQCVVPNPSADHRTEILKGGPCNMFRVFQNIYLVGKCIYTYMCMYTHICRCRCMCTCCMCIRIYILHKTYHIYKSYVICTYEHVLYRIVFCNTYGVATMSRRLKIIGLFCRI